MGRRSNWNHKGKFVSSIVRVAASRRMSRAVAYNGLVFVSGQTAEDRTQDIDGQTRQVLAKVDKFLAEAGTDKTRLLSAQIRLRDIQADFAGMNEVWDGWVAEGAAPARATAQCAMASPEILVEIIVTAASGE
jgi:enamine deaminase RidA (YjgF/YER057c/UK114 family)